MHEIGLTPLEYYRYTEYYVLKSTVRMRLVFTPVFAMLEVM